MNREKITAGNPLRTLNAAISGGLGAGNLGVTMARAGVGKTAFLVHLGLDALLQGRSVLHLAAGQTTEHVHAWYDALFRTLARQHGCDDVAPLLADMARRRLIQTYAADMPVTPERLEQAIGLYQGHLSFSPDVLLIDGFDWEALSLVPAAAALGGFLSCARRLRAELWMSAQTHRSVVTSHPVAIPAPCADYAELIDVAVYLEPDEDQVSIRVLKDHGNQAGTAAPLCISCDTLCLTAQPDASKRRLPSSGYTLLSGGAQGSEAFFGECAERWGLQEINYSFHGHTAARTRGRVHLTDLELALGAVSDAYLHTHMHRTYPDTPLFRKVLQSIWHQVNTAGEVFVAGNIQDDNTVRGGTGWAAELARHWHKPLHVFDQEKSGWFMWRDNRWEPETAPVITSTRFTGTGTRFLSDSGKQAIRELFERSFGAPGSKK